MKIRRLLGGVVKFAGPAVAGFFAGGPAGAGLSVTAQIAGALEKRRGKARELAKGAPPVHKATAPAAAVIAPATLAALLGAFGIHAPPWAAAALAGAIAVLAHQIGTGIERSGARRPVG